MRVISIILAVIYFASAAVQFNDPDPYFWVALYGGCGLIALLAAFKRFYPWLALLGLAVCTFELFRLAPAFWTWITNGAPSITSSMHAESPHIELVREFLGLIICLAGLLYLYIRGRKVYLKNRESTDQTP